MMLSVRLLYKVFDSVTYVFKKLEKSNCGQVHVKADIVKNFGHA